MPNVCIPARKLSALAAIASTALAGCASNAGNGDRSEDFGSASTESSAALQCAPLQPLEMPSSQEEVVPSEGAPPCPEGQVPQPTARLAPKGAPPIGSSPPPLQTETATASFVDFLYSGAFQFIGADGASAGFMQPKPELATTDFHSLGELAVESVDGLQIVEVGWNVDRGVNGNANPHLFVFHWVNGVPTCYNACGWVQVSSTRMPGMTVSVTTTPQSYKIEHFSKAWWVGYQGEWIGNFPDSIWSGAGVSFTSGALFQWFGEVAASTPTPCTDMGDGLFSSFTSAAKMSSLSLLTGSTSRSASITMDADTNQKLYTGTEVSASNLRFGGPGSGPCQ